MPMKTDAVKVPGASLYYEVVGTGPVLLCIAGGPTDAGVFADLAERLSGKYTVVSYDERGHSRSTVESPFADVPVATHADDAAALLRELSDGPAFVYGSSGGGTIGLELVVRHCDLVKTLVVHEAPVMELLPDAERWRGIFAGIGEAFRTDGVFAAMGKFGAAVEEGGPKYSEEMQQADAPPPDPEMMQRMMGNFEHFIANEIQPIGAYVPDIDVLSNVPTRVVVAGGQTSGEQGAYRAAVALAARLGIELTSLPGAHGGWGSDPQEFADRLDAVLRDA